MSSHTVSLSQGGEAQETRQESEERGHERIGPDVRESGSNLIQTFICNNNTTIQM